MQWLIDLVIEAIGVPPCYIDRGDPGDVDFDQTDFTDDAAWHTLDLSAIVPENAQAVNLTAFIVATEVSKVFWFREDGNVNSYNASGLSTQIAFQPVITNMSISLSTDRKLAYNLDPSTWLSIGVTVCGWWL